MLAVVGHKQTKKLKQEKLVFSEDHVQWRNQEASNESVYRNKQKWSQAAYTVEESRRLKQIR